MSDLPHDYRERLDLREQIARIDKSIDEAAKLRAEQSKLMAEAGKFNRDPWILSLAALIGAFAVVIARLPEILHAFGVG
jgi:hypothetical protein